MLFCGVSSLYGIDLASKIWICIRVNMCNALGPKGLICQQRCPSFAPGSHGHIPCGGLLHGVLQVPAIATSEKHEAARRVATTGGRIPEG